MIIVIVIMIILRVIVVVMINNDDNDNNDNDNSDSNSNSDSDSDRSGRGSAVSTLPWLPRKEPLERWRVAIEECLSGEPSARPAVEGVCDMLFGTCSASNGAVIGSSGSMDSSGSQKIEVPVRL